VQSKELVSGIP